MSDPLILQVSIQQQQLKLRRGDETLAEYAVSTASNGPGEKYSSECTPTGMHKVRAKIGQDCVANTVFVGRRPTAETFSEDLRQQFPGRDWILTRILWLSGLEPGINRLGDVDTMRRYIYIHGCPDADQMGVASSHGCIKMANADVIELFDLVPTGTTVEILRNGFDTATT